MEAMLKLSSLCGQEIDDKRDTSICSEEDLCIEKGSKEDKLESAKAEMSKVKEENERLKMMIERVGKNYHSLQLRFFDILHRETSNKGVEDSAVSLDEVEEPKLVSLCLGTSPWEHKKDGIICNSSKHKENEDLEASLTLGLDCKGVSSKEQVSDMNTSEEKEEDSTNKLVRTKDGGDEISEITPPAKRARVCVRARCDSPVMHDGCQWRKYGQKIAKGNPCPRAYYRCTLAPACPVRKQVQRCADDMSILITTYEGTHNHPIPASATAMASTTSAAVSMLLSGSSTSQPTDHSFAYHANSPTLFSGVNFSLLDQPRANQVLLPTPSSHLLPTITLDLTSTPSYSLNQGNCLPSNFASTPRFPPLSLNFWSPESNIPLSFWGKGIPNNGTIPIDKTHIKPFNIGNQFQEHFYQHYFKNQTPFREALAEQDLFGTALQFRLQRHNGWPSCSDVFKKFLDKSGTFKESITNDIWGMLSLYEASYLGAKGEEVLQQAMDFSKAHLHQSLPHLSPELRKLVAKALTLPRHLRMGRLEARNYMEKYSQATNQIPALMELAKLDFAMVQSMHQKELAEISRWWKNLGLVERLGFARDRPAECFLWTVGTFPEPRYSNCRIELTKTICILLVMDDIFDTYGTLEELVLFTEAIKRWDLDAMEQLPEYMKICYMALFNTTHEIAYKIQKEHGQTVVACLKRTWIDIFEAFLKEAKWFNNGYIPTFKEYLDNGVISSGSYMALVHATFLIGDSLSKETISIMKPYPRLFSCSGEILRLWDDLGTSREEQERGDNACSIQCLMTENNLSDENVARKHIRQLIQNLWPELNGLAMTTTALPSSVMKASLNMARTAQVIYQHGDDQNTFTVDDYVKTLILTPSSNY